MIRCFSWTPPLGAPNTCTVRSASPPSIGISASCSCASSSSSASRRSLVSLSLVSVAVASGAISAFSSPALADFSEIPNSGGVKALDLRIGDGEVPVDGDQVAIHYYGRLAAKQGWRFDSTYDHKDSSGEAVPFTFILGDSGDGNSCEVDERRRNSSGDYSSIARLPEYVARAFATKRMVLTSSHFQRPILQIYPPNGIRFGGLICKKTVDPHTYSCMPKSWRFFDRQRLFATIFNPTRLANGQGSSLGTLIFDIELVSLRHL